MSADLGSYALFIRMMRFNLLLDNPIFVNLKSNKMRRATYNVLYLIYRAKKMKDGKVPIQARVTINKQWAEFATGRYVDPDQWNNKQCKVTSGTKEEREINTYLDVIKLNLLLKKREMEEQSRPVTYV